MLDEVRALIELYGLRPLPVEGTLFAGTYRSRGEFPDGKPHGTAMVGLYCEEPRSVSLFHRLAADEVWHFYSGDPLRLILIHPDGSSEEVVMGGDPFAGQLAQFVVPAGVWQAGELLPGGRFALYGCTMAPGFTGDSFEGGSRERLEALCPARKADIARLGCGPETTHMPNGFAT